MSDIDRKRAIEILKTKTLRPIPFDNSAESGQEIIDFYEALNMAISSLETDEAYQLEYESTTKSETLISLEVYKQVARERDIAIEQLHELGYEFGQKIEPTTKDDCETCIHNKGVFECDMYGCKYEPTTKNDLGVDCNNCKNNFHRGDGTSYCATGDGMCHYECEEPTTKNDLGVDCISRADARSLICNTDIKHHMSGMSRKVFKDLYNGMDELPPVTPIRPKGHWIVQPSNKEQGERDFIWWKCSECGQVIFSETEHNRLEFHAFCGRCGADMSGEVEE